MARLDPVRARAPASVLLPGLIALVAALAGCSSGPAPAAASASFSAPPGASGLISSLPPPEQATAPPSPSELLPSQSIEPTATSPAATAPGGGVAIDPALLAVLPPEIAGHPLDEALEAEASAIGDPALARDVERLATAFVHDDRLENWAIVSVTAVRAGAFDEAFFRSWRDSFDAAVCEAAGGVAGHAEATIGGHQVAIGTCAGGLRTYSLHLEQGDLLISISAVGDERYGELVIAGLTPSSERGLPSAPR